MPDLVIKKGNTKPILEALLYEGEALADLTTAEEVKLVIKPPSGAAKKIKAEFTKATGGKVKYKWKGTSEDSGGAAGAYLIEWEVKYADGTVENFPNAGAKEIEIQPILE